MPSGLDVLHIYSGNLFGGIERMLISLAGVPDGGMQHHFALCFEGRLSRALRAAGGSVSLLAPVRLSRPLSVLRSRRALRRLLATRQYDAIVCHSVWSYDIFSSTIRKGGYAPILYLHDIPAPNNWYYRFAWLTPPALCIVNSDFTASALSPLRPSVNTRRVRPLVLPPSPSDPTAVQRLRTTWHSTEDDVVILLASRLDPLKGHRNLFAALAALRGVPRWRCWIAGAPQRPEEEAYRQELIGQLGALDLADRVSFIGHRDDMELVLAACDVYCQPNETPEAFGMVFAEALYAGKPIVGRAFGGALEVLSDECGIPCGPGVETLRSALLDLIQNEDLRVRLGQAGPARALALCGPERFLADFGAALRL